MRPVREAEVSNIPSCDVEMVGIRELGRIPVRSSEQQKHPVAGANLDISDRDVVASPAAGKLRRAVLAQQLLDGAAQACGVGSQIFELFGVAQQG